MKKALMISVTLNILIVSAFVIKRAYYRQPAGGSLSEWSIAWNEQKNDLYSTAPIDSGDIVFIGDSHIERFLLNDYYPGRNIRNRGIGSNTTEQVISRLPSILKRKPSKLFIQVGVNDLAFGYPVDKAYYNIVEICVLANASKVPLYINSVFPTRAADGRLNNDIVKLNEKVKSYCKTNGVTYIDIHPNLLMNGELNKDYTIDDSHLNSKGYAIWKKAIDQYVR
jgi:lysophospholipase L1-like esterase